MLGVAAVLLCLVPWAPARRPDPAALGAGRVEGAARGRIVHEVRSPYSLIRVRDDGARRALYFVRDGGVEVLETAVDLRAPERLQVAYTRTMLVTLLYRAEPTGCLIVGLGGGAMVRFLNHFFPEVGVDAVEIDAEVVRVAREYFGIMAGPRTRIHTEDGARFLARDGDRYDVVLVDAFLEPGEGTDASGVPLRLKTDAFLHRVRDRLSVGGVAAFNLHAGPGTARDLDAMRAAFGRADVFDVPGTGNVVAVAPAGAVPADSALRARARALDRRRDHGFSFQRLLEQRRRA